MSSTSNNNSTTSNNNNENIYSKKTKDEFLVHGLETIEPAYDLFPGKMYAGMLPCTHATRSSGEMMFWMFEPDQQSVPDTLVIWLNGGPGCSSFNCGVMMEHSPVTQPLHDAGYCCLKATPQLSYNNYTWTKATTMLYVEQPVGTGFSFGHPFPENETQVSADLYAFMQNFYDVFPHLRKSDFFVFGESYAGMFVPSIARYFHVQNVDTKNDPAKYIPIKGAAIGNGWMDARVQGPATIDYSWWHGLIDQPTRDALHIEWKNCMEGNPGGAPFHPFNIQDDCGIMWGILAAAGNPNAYDITTWDPNVDQITFTSEAFYNRPDVKKMLHAPQNITWHGCRWGEGRRRHRSRQLLVGQNGDNLHLHSQVERPHARRLYMDNDRPLSVVPYVAELVDAGIPVIVYNGDRDMTTNMVGSELLLNNMEWSGKDGWMDASRGLWMVDGYEAGWAKEFQKLYFVVVYNSGHMVPYNRPAQAYDLLERFLKGESFIDVESPQIRVKRSNGSPITSPDTLASLTMMGDYFPSLGKSAASITSGPSSSSSSRLELFAVASVSMLVGVLVTLLTMRMQRRRRQHQYQQVPDTSLD